MQPKQTRWHVEYWFPSDIELNIHSLKVPVTKLRPTTEIPLFQWARESEVRVWKALVKAYQTKTTLPEPSSNDPNLWAPSGMENLDAAFSWAISNTNGVKSDLWKFYYGTWLAGRGESEVAIQILSSTKTVLAKVLLGRLLKLKGDIKGAKNAFGGTTEKWLQLHPEIIVERDKVLRSLGKSTLEERIIERKVQLLIDKDEIEKAKELLLSTAFQKVHQTYTRTNLWIQICEKLKISYLPVPPQLGEDRLATFGAYREYE